jgi:hypothetical protein
MPFRRELARKRRSLVGKYPLETAVPDLHDITDDGSESDSGDDFEDDFVEDDIKKAELEMAHASRMEPALPRDEIEALYLAPFIENSIDKEVADWMNAKSKTCVSVETSNDSALESNILERSMVIEPKLKGRSRPATPMNEPGPAAKAILNDASAGPQAEAQVSTEFLDENHKLQNVTNIRQVDAVFGSLDGLDMVHPNPEIKSEAPGKLITNGKTRKSAPMEIFDDSESDQESELIEPTEDDIQAVRKKMKTPPLSNLPTLHCKPWHQDDEFIKTLESEPAVTAFIIYRMAGERARKLQEQEEEAQAWKERYLRYRRWTDFSDDEAAVRSRETFAKSREKRAAEAAAILTSTPAPGSKPEPQRRTGSRFATEHDIERVLRESEQEARETKEREERLARAHTASAKEAKIPDMCWNEEERLQTAYADKSHLVSFERSFAVLEFGEPIDNFTEEECEIFEKAYLETPKQWGKIAEALPQRDYKACIQHYYLVKRSAQLKEKVKKRGKRQKRAAPKGAKPKSNALMADIVSRDEGEDGLDMDNGGERRRPRRAAAPTFAFEATPGESEAPSPAPTPGRKSAAIPKGENGSETVVPKKRKVREKGPKQAKNSQLLAAAPTSRGAGSPSLPQNLSAGRGSTGSNAFPQYDGAARAPSNFGLPYPHPNETANNPLASNFDVMPQTFADQEPLGSAPPMGIESQQDRRSIQQTSSYWSVPEQNDFPALLQHFGTDWTAIAKHMTSKTHVMVYTPVF